MDYEDGTIKVARDATGDPPWLITNARLKLAIKYGIARGTPSPQSNWSVAFDAYALRRGPQTGVPTLADLSTTQLMNSRVSNRDLLTLGEWLSVRQNITRLEQIRSVLASSNGLQCANDDAVRLVGRLVDDMLGKRDRRGRRSLRGIGRAKIFKWLSAWAPAHIPMIDQYVAWSLTEMRGNAKAGGSGELLARFRELLTTEGHLAGLTRLGEWLKEQLGGHLPCAVPPVRVLDNLLWCDWWACWRKDGDFAKWVIPNDRNRIEYRLTGAGTRLAAALRT